MLSPRPYARVIRHNRDHLPPAEITCHRLSAPARRCRYFKEDYGSAGQLAAAAKAAPTIGPPGLASLLAVSDLAESRLEYGVLNALGLWAVVKVLAWSKDVSTPVSVLRIHVGFRVDDQQLQERLRFLRTTMMPVQHGQFFTFEETVQLICRPPRGTHIAYADLTATPLGSKQKGYDLFKQFAAVEQVAAEAEEQNLLSSQKPEDCKVSHRSPLQRLLGVAETEDADECQACVVISLVVLALGTISVPDMVTRDKHFFRTCMKELCTHLSSGQMLAVELLITPDDPADFLSEAQLMRDYPFMTDLSSGTLISEPDGDATSGAARTGAASTNAVGSGLGAASPGSGASGAATATAAAET
eukprot:gene4167-4414_t